MIVHAVHQSGFAFELHARGHCLVSDQSLNFGGEDQGPMPSELLLWAVSSCFGQTMVFVAAKMKKTVHGLKLSVHGEKDKTSCRYALIHIGVSGNEPQEFLEKIATLAKKYCYVTNSLSREVQLEFTVTGSS